MTDDNREDNIDSTHYYPKNEVIHRYVDELQDTYPERDDDIPLSYIIIGVIIIVAAMMATCAYFQ